MEKEKTACVKPACLPVSPEELPAKQGAEQVRIFETYEIIKINENLHSFINLLRIMREFITYCMVKCSMGMQFL